MAGRRKSMLRLLPSPKAAAEARAGVAELCGDLPDETADCALLLTSELVTNAVLHGRGMVTVAIECEDNVVAVAVGDESPDEPAQRQEHEPAEGGRGLFLLETMAGSWGVRRSRDGGGKVVWFRTA